jgi:hypothetical protein
LWDQERAEEVLVDVGGRRAAERYQALFERNARGLDELLRKCRVDSIDIDTDADYIKPLTVFFRARARRR